MVVLAEFAQGAGGGDDDEIRNLATQPPLVEQIDDSTGEAVFRGLTFIRIARTALMARFRYPVRASQSALGCLVAGGAKQIELFAVGDDHDRSFREQHEISRV